MNTPELVAPAGSPATLLAGIRAGADAFYFGVGALNARVRAQNFTLEEMEDLVRTAREHRKRAYLALNVLVSDRDVKECVQLLERAEACCVDAVIIQDLGVLHLMKKYFPRLRIHASTQMFLHNSLHIEALARRGVSRVILPREFMLDEIRAVRSRVSVELEVFLHGALCFSFSGLCLASSWLFGESGNRGLCKQVCRFAFESADAAAGVAAECGAQRDSGPSGGESGATAGGRPGRHRLPRDWKTRGSRPLSASPLPPARAGRQAESPRPAGGRQFYRRHPFAMRDLEGRTCLKALLECGVQSLKIEGRLRNADYVEEAVSYYRSCLDAHAAGRPLPPPPRWRFGRATTAGYFSKLPYQEMICTDEEPWIGELVGRVTRWSAGRATVVFEKPVARGERMRIVREDGVRVHEFTLLDHQGRYCEVEVEPHAGRQSPTRTADRRGRTGGHPRTGASKKGYPQSQYQAAPGEHFGFVGLKDADLEGVQAGHPRLRVYRLGTSQTPSSRFFRKSAARLQVCPADLEIQYARGEFGVSALLEGGTRFETRLKAESCGQAKPLKPDRVRDCFARVDKAPFRLGSISVRLDGPLCLPIRTLNELRRDFYRRLERFFDEQAEARNTARRQAIRAEFEAIGARHAVEQPDGRTRSGAAGKSSPFPCGPARAGGEVRLVPWEEGPGFAGPQARKGTDADFWLELPLFVSEGSLAETIRRIEDLLKRSEVKVVSHSLGWIDLLRGRLPAERIAAGSFLYCYNRFACQLLREAGAGRVFLSGDFRPEEVRALLALKDVQVSPESPQRFFVTRQVLPSGYYRFRQFLLRSIRRREYTELVLVRKSGSGRSVRAGRQ